MLDALENIDCSDGVGLSALKCDVVDDAVNAIKALSSADLTQNIATTIPYSTTNFRANNTRVTISLEDQVKEILDRLTNPKLMRIKCHQCGASIDQIPDNHIVKCPYCRTTYFIGTKMVYDEP